MTLVGVHDHLALHVSSGPADRLDQRGLRAEKALLVGVEDGYQRHLGKVESLPQEVDSHQHVELAEAQIPQDFDALDGVDLGVEIAHPQAHLQEVLGEVLGHLLGQRRDQDAGVGLDAGLDLIDQIVDLTLGRLDDDLGVHEAGGPHDLLHHLSGHLAFVGRRVADKKTT